MCVSICVCLTHSGQSPGHSSGCWSEGICPGYRRYHWSHPSPETTPSHLQSCSSSANQSVGHQKRKVLERKVQRYHIGYNSKLGDIKLLKWLKGSNRYLDLEALDVVIANPDVLAVVGVWHILRSIPCLSGSLRQESTDLGRDRWIKRLQSFYNNSLLQNF